MLARDFNIAEGGEISYSPFWGPAAELEALEVVGRQAGGPETSRGSKHVRAGRGSRGPAAQHGPPWRETRSVRDLRCPAAP